MAQHTLSLLMSLVLELQLRLKDSDLHLHLRAISASLLVLLEMDGKTRVPEALQRSLKINRCQQTPVLFLIIWGFGDSESL